MHAHKKNMCVSPLAQLTKGLKRSIIIENRVALTRKVSPNGTLSVDERKERISCGVKARPLNK